jgi:hypothetical protein
MNIKIKNPAINWVFNLKKYRIIEIYLIIELRQQ